MHNAQYGLCTVRKSFCNLPGEPPRRWLAQQDACGRRVTPVACAPQFGARCAIDGRQPGTVAACLHDARSFLT
jgi:hypothetical protein